MMDFGRIFGPREVWDSSHGYPSWDAICANNSRAGMVFRWYPCIVLGDPAPGPDGRYSLVQRLNWLGRLYYLHILPLFRRKGTTP